VPKPFASFPTSVPKDEMLELLDIRICKLVSSERISKSLLALWRFDDHFKADIFRIQESLIVMRDLRQKVAESKDDNIEVTIQILEQGT